MLIRTSELSPPRWFFVASNRQLVLLWMAIIEQVGMFKVVVENLFANVELERTNFFNSWWFKSSFHNPKGVHGVDWTGGLG